MVCAKARLAARFGPLTATSIGVGEPRLMTRLTMSLGSKEKLTSGICSREASAQPLLERLDRDAGAPGFNCTCSTPSSGPPFHR